MSGAPDTLVDFHTGLERVHLVAFTPAEQRKLKAAAAARFAAPAPATAADTEAAAK